MRVFTRGQSTTGAVHDHEHAHAVQARSLTAFGFAFSKRGRREGKAGRRLEMRVRSTLWQWLALDFNSHIAHTAVDV